MEGSDSEETATTESSTATGVQIEVATGDDALFPDGSTLVEDEKRGSDPRTAASPVAVSDAEEVARGGGSVLVATSHGFSAVEKAIPTATPGAALVARNLAMKAMVEGLAWCHVQAPVDCPERFCDSGEVARARLGMHLRVGNNQDVFFYWAKPITLTEK